MRKYHHLLAIIFLVSILLSSCGETPNTQTPETDPQPLAELNDDIVSASAEVVAGKSANLAFMVGGQEMEIYVQAGSRVKEGDVLAALPEDALPQTILLAQADLINAQEILNDLLDSDIARAQSAIALRDAQEAYDKAVDWRRELNGKIDIKEIVYQKIGNTRYPKIKEYKGYADAVTIAEADEDVELTKAILDDAQREFDRLVDKSISAEVLAAQTRVAAIEATINQSKLIAPFDGTVVELYGNSGEMVSPGVPILLLADLSTVQVRTTDLNEVDVARVQIGDPVKVTFDALPNAAVTGKVTDIGLKNAAGSGVYFNVSIALDEIPEELRWGMSAFVEIQVSR